VPAGKQGHDRQKDAVALARDGALDVTDYASNPPGETVVVQRGLPVTRRRIEII
jgi:hypothetical protein